MEQLALGRTCREVTVIATPVAKGRPRFGRGRVFTPRKTEKAEWEIRQAWIDAHGEHPVSCAVRLEILALVAQPQSIPKYRRATAMPATRPDVDNYLKTALDALNAVAFADDAQVVEVEVRKAYAIGCPPQWRIRVLEIEG